MTIDEALVAADSSAREAALDVTGSFIVQAPAGSGKTELLIQRYLKLLATVDDPEEILAITFTRKAAAEMEQRIVAALKRSSRQIVPEQAHERVTAAAADAALARDQERGWHLVEYPRRMRIQTLDSLNSSIARAQPLTAGGAAASRVASDTEMQALYREAAALTLDQLLEDGIAGEAAAQVLSHVDCNTGLYLQYLARMLGTRDQWLPFVGSGAVNEREEQELRLRLERNLAAAVTDQLRHLRSTLPPPADEIARLAALSGEWLIDNGSSEHPACKLRGRRDLPGGSASDLDAWRGIADLLLTADGQFRKTVDRRQGFPARSPQRIDMLKLLEAIRDMQDFRQRLHEVRLLPPVRYTDEQWVVLLALFRLLPVAVIELTRLFALGGTTDYIEIALNAASALGTAEEPGDVALLLDYRLSHILVDEMQDTSSAQYRMLEALTGGWQNGDGRTLFCVGDPMQSIYRFRNAEVGQFLMARERGIGELDLQPLTLRRNFRSGEHLVDWFNAVFPEVLAERNDARDGAVAYSRAVSVPGQAGLGTCEVHPVFGSSGVTEAREGCQVVRRLLAEHPGDDIAILVRGRTRLPGLLAELRDAGVPYRAVDIDRLTDLPEIIDILALTRALVHRGDRLAWLSVLRSPWAGLDWADLHALVSGSRQETVAELLCNPERLAVLSRHGRQAAASVRDLIAGESQRSSRTDCLRDRVERLWFRLGGPALLADSAALENIYRYLDVLSRLERGGTLDDVARLENALDLEHVSSSADAQLQVMTIHRAKGLQFDHVLLYGLGRKPRRGEHDVLSWFDMPTGHGNNEKIISPIGPRAVVERDALHRFIEDHRGVQERHETGRLLYVACTRARKSLHLVGNVELDDEGRDIRRPAANTLLHRLWPAVEQDFVRAFGSGRQGGHGQPEEAWLLPELRRLARPWALAEPVPLPGLETGPGPDYAQSVDFDWVGSGARLAGTLVHRWLHHAAARRITLSDLDEKAIKRTTLGWLAESGMTGAAAAPIAARVYDALIGIRSDPSGRWLLDGQGFTELSLTGRVSGRVETVVLDRVRIDEDGVHWIVDYKTSAHEGGDLESFLAAEALRYRAQLSRYAAFYGEYAGVRPRCALYFPLLQKLVPVGT